MLASMITVFAFLLCSQFEFSVAQGAVIDPLEGHVKVDCKDVKKGSLKDLIITLPKDFTAKAGDNVCTFTQNSNKFTANPTCTQTALTVLVLKTADASSTLVTNEIRYFNVSCIDGGTEHVKEAVVGIDVKPVVILPKVTLLLSKSDPGQSVIAVAALTRADTAKYTDSLYMIFELPNGVSKTLIPLSCKAEGSASQSPVTLFDISNPSKCIQKPQETIWKGFTPDLFMKTTTIENTAVTYGNFKVFSFIEPFPKVTISCDVRVCDTRWTDENSGAGLCKSDYQNLKGCSIDNNRRRRRDVKPLTRMTSGQEHGQVHRVSTSYSIDENFGATGGCSHISLTFSLPLLSFLALVL